MTSGTKLRRGLSHLVGWAMDRKVPKFARSFVYRVFSKITGADLTESELHPAGYPSLGQVFVRRLKPGARPLATDPSVFSSPCDGVLSEISTVTDGTLLQVKGQPYAAAELLGEAGADLDLEGATAFTIYLSPRDYHRVHGPLDSELDRLAWLGHERHSVRESTLLRVPRVFVRNERVALRLETEHGPLLLVLVGALNVGRLRVVGVPSGSTQVPAGARQVARGAELGRFEMGSTVVGLWPRSNRRRLEFRPSIGSKVRTGEALADLHPPDLAAR